MVVRRIERMGRVDVHPAFAGWRKIIGSFGIICFGFLDELADDLRQLGMGLLFPLKEIGVAVPTVTV